MDDASSVQRPALCRIVRRCTAYLDLVMEEKKFVLQKQLLMFIKKFRKASLQVLPPSFFLLVNTVSVCLLKVSKEEPHKIRKFVNYWLDRIELEMVVDEDFDYPKYVLRNNLCSILIEEGEYKECLKFCNFNIKEITSDVCSAHPDTKTGRRQRTEGEASNSIDAL